MKVKVKVKNGSRAERVEERMVWQGRPALAARGGLATSRWRTETVRDDAGGRMRVYDEPV